MWYTISINVTEGGFFVKYHYLEKQVSVQDAVKEYAEKKIGKLERLFKKESDAQITFTGEGVRQTLEVTVSNDGMFYRARETGNDLFGAVDKAVAAIERQIRKNKTRLEKRLRQGAFEREVEIPHTSLEEEQDFAIVRTKRFALKPMTPEEAILQMNLLNHEFFVFRNFANGGNFAVVYRRGDGGYGLIEEG